MIEIKFNPFCREKDLQSIKKDIFKSVKNLDFRNQMALLSIIIKDLADKNKDLVYTKILLDQSIDYLLSRYTPEEAILHLGFIAENIVKRHPELQGKIEQLTKPRVLNGVV